MPQGRKQGRRLKAMQTTGIEDFDEDGPIDEPGDDETRACCAGVIREVKQRNRYCTADYSTALKYFQKTVRPERVGTPRATVHD